MNAHKVISRALREGVEELSFETQRSFPYAGETVAMRRVKLEGWELEFAPRGTTREYVVYVRTLGAPDRLVIRAYDRDEAYEVFTSEACSAFVRSVSSAREDVDPRAVNHPLHALAALVMSPQPHGAGAVSTESPYTRELRASGALTVAPSGAMCGRCPSRGPGRREAVHRWVGRNLCAWHSPFDVTASERAELHARRMPETLTGVEVSRSSFTGSTVSRVMTPGSALRSLEASEGPVEVLEAAMLGRYRDVVMCDPWDEFTVWSVRTVGVLPMVCTVDHGGGFFESE